MLCNDLGADISGIRDSIYAKKGMQVMLCVQKGDRKRDILEGIIQNVYPQIFTFVVCANNHERTYSYSFNEVASKQIKIVVPGY